MTHRNAKICRCGARAFPHRPDLGCAVWAADQDAWRDRETKEELDHEESMLIDRDNAAAINRREYA